MTIKVRHIAKSSESRAAAFIAGASKPEPGKTTVNMRFNAVLLARVDGAARHQGISRTAWLHVAAAKALETGS
jgi:hypothetical protein